LRIIRGSANRDEARVKLLAFEFTRRQVEALLGAARMRLTGWYTDTENRFAVGLAVAVAS